MKRRADGSIRSPQRRDGSYRLPARLRADCAACCGLCCVALPFDASAAFAFDKPAHTPCAMLRPDDRCAIHDRLAASGFPGCAAYDCHGAGQRVVRQYFDGASWRASPEVAILMFDAFRRVRVLHESLAILTLAMLRTRDARARRRLRRRFVEIETMSAGGRSTLERLDVAAIRNRTLELVRALS